MTIFCRSVHFSRAHGFTIVEILIVIVIVSIMAIIAIPRVFNMYEEMRLAGVTTELAVQIEYARQRIISLQPPQPAPEDIDSQTEYPIISIPGDGTYSISNVPYSERLDETGIIGPGYGTVTSAAGEKVTFDVGGTPLDLNDPINMPIYDWDDPGWDPDLHDLPPIIGYSFYRYPPMSEDLVITIQNPGGGLSKDVKIKAFSGATIVE